MVLKDYLTIYSDRHTYLPKRWVNGGFTGQVPAYPTDEFILLLNPAAKSNDILDGLEVLVRQLRKKRSVR